MSDYIVIENDQGLRVAEVENGKTSEQVAVENRGVIIDSGPYHTFDQAYDAMMQVPPADKDRAPLRE